MTTRRFAGSFRKVSKKKNCTKLKDHYTGAMRELVGILDLWATNDHERFVFARVSEIRKRCKYFKSDKSYGPRWIEKGLAELRARNIVSKRLMRVRDHEEKWGYIVAPHACLTMHVDGKCILTGELGEGTSGRWARSGDGGPDSVLYWAGYADEKPVSGPVHKPLGKPVSGPVHRPGDKPVCGPVTTLQLGSDNTEVSRQNRGRTVSNRQQPVQPERPGKPIDPTKPFELALPVEAPAATKSNGKPPSSLSSSPAAPDADLTMTTAPKAGAVGLDGDKTAPAAQADVTVTIGQHFAYLSDNNLLDAITDGTLIMNILENEISSTDKSFLVACCEMAVEESAVLSWDGQRTTCARLMNRAAALMTNQGKRWPSGWLKLLKALEKGGPCVAKPQRPRPAETRMQYAKEVNGFYGDILAVRERLRANRTKYPNNGSSWEMCADGYKRAAEGRAADGYTVMAADGVWEKA